MRKIVAGAFVSLDGVMQAPGGPPEDPSGGFTYGGWTVPYWDEPMGQFMSECFTQPFDLLLGRKTYEIFAAHWPFVGEDDPIGKTFNEVTKYVATSSTTPLTWKNSVALNGDVAARIARLKQGKGPILLTQGSSVLLQTLLSHDLVDEFRLLTFPLVLGSGKRLFGQGTQAGALKLVESKVSTTGVTMGVYSRAGAVEIGSFELPNTSEAELARREKAKREG
ncbi:MAG: dihydrofolate reductase [Reyranella sp.]|uniref:dihydrofolate reductase family protein n=1 Tax=Reyranella sp. TaxID=1929291 RepID=UPI001221C099|nr:dihydrofolate reductase family protein [Reyranella sp.]TAJ94944.1 MAG: dihydrofolate reductase [Reyranella sp.]TBR29976.1 MAG: dihydrofolate reductase [Reyranella sp.]